MFEATPWIWQAAVFTLAMAVIRVLSDGVERAFVRIILEGFYCVGLQMTCYFAILAMNLKIEWAMVTAGVIGFTGTIYSREVMRTVILRKLQIEDINRQGFTHLRTGKEHEKAAVEITGSPQPPGGIFGEPRDQGRGGKDD